MHLALCLQRANLDHAGCWLRRHELAGERDGARPGTGTFGGRGPGGRWWSGGLAGTGHLPRRSGGETR